MAYLFISKAATAEKRIKSAPEVIRGIFFGHEDTKTQRCTKDGLVYLGALES